jgi:hypothetical protein
MSENNEAKKIALAYIEAVGRRDFAAAERLLARDVRFDGPAGTIEGLRDVSAAYRRVGPIVLRNEPKKVFVDGNEVCVIYDFVTDTPAGAVPTVEWITIEGGLIRSLWLLTDHIRFPTALAELRRRAAHAATNVSHD